MEYIIFTDGSSRGNPGSGGWGSVVVELRGESGLEAQKVTELGGGEKNTTNNRMEIMSAVEGLSRIAPDSRVTVFTDSSYLVNGITKWVYGWQKNGWVTKTKESVMNKDLWMRLVEAVKGKKIEWKRIAGHAGVLGNERCDHIATTFADGEKSDLFDGPFSDYDLPNILDVSHDEDKMSEKRSSSSHSKAKAYSYVSSVGGVIEVHHTWAECEKRVKGAKGARYKKSLNKDGEIKIIEEFETL